jgi:hypothetical protein
MVSLIIIAVIIIGAVALVLILVPRIKRWIKGRMLKENDETIPLYNCSIASRGNESGTSNSGDIYDCVEANGEETEPN